MYRYLINILMLLSASLSLHSALALPLSSVLEKNYQEVATSNVSVKPYKENTTLSDFAYQQSGNQKLSQSKLPTSLRLLLQENTDHSLLLQSLLCEVITLTINHNQAIQSKLRQSQLRQSYLAQLSAHTDIIGQQNTLYSQKNSYQAKLEQQRTS